MEFAPMKSDNMYIISLQVNKKMIHDYSFALVHLTGWGSVKYTSTHIWTPGMYPDPTNTFLFKFLWKDL